MVVVKNVVLSYVLSFFGLLIVAFLLYKIRISEQTIKTCMWVIYGAASFMAGFLSGKQLKKMKFIWGLAAGVLYFIVLVMLSFISGNTNVFNRDFLLTLFMCAGSGMLGGMISS